MNRKSLVIVGLAALAAASAAPADAGTPRADRQVVRRQRRLLIGGPRAFLGVTTLDVTPELRAFYGAPKEEGVLVASIAAGSPAAASGMKVGDVITRVEGRAVASPWELADELADRRKGDRLTLDLVRDRAPRKMEVTLAEREESETDAADDLPEGWPRPMVLRLPRLEKLDEVLRTPEWKERLDGLDECDRVRKRLESVEQRLKALEQKLPPR